MPIEKIFTWASLVIAGLMITHPLTWKMELAKLEVSMLRQSLDTRSWGNPDIFQYAPSARRAHHAKK